MHTCVHICTQMYTYVWTNSGIIQSSVPVWDGLEFKPHLRGHWNEVLVSTDMLPPTASKQSPEAPQCPPMADA